jgi:signal transduction histidine kinase
MITADQFTEYLTWVVYLALFAQTLAVAIRRRRWADGDIALLFGAPALTILIAGAERFGLLPDGMPLLHLALTTGAAMPYLLLRLANDVFPVPRGLLRLAEVGLAAIALIVWLPQRSQLLLASFVGIYIVGLLSYSAWTFFRAARRDRGVTARRMYAAGQGTVLLGASIVLDTLRLPFTMLAPVLQLAADLVWLASGLAYYVAFATPVFLRHAWQEPELRAFLGRAARLPRLPSRATILAELERGAAEACGATRARIGRWDTLRERLRFTGQDGTFELEPVPENPAGRAFLEQRAVFAPRPADLDRRQPRSVAPAILAAPISAGERRIGVLAIYAPRPSIFADDDLDLVQLLADQAAVILESRALIEDAARAQARVEAARLKDDFLSGAAHDLKTPLTTLVAQAQLMERRALRRPDAPADLHAIRLLVQESRRLSSLVRELLDATAAERGRLLDAPAPVNLTQLARDVCERYSSDRHRCIVTASGPVIGSYDAQRMEQLLVHLIENAVTYSPDGGTVHVLVEQKASQAEITVVDRGIGILPEDLPHIFERFHRGANVDDRRFPGMGLGLYISRGIAEEHGGRITVTSRPGEGTRFHVVVPLEPAEIVAYAS